MLLWKLSNNTFQAKLVLKLRILELILSVNKYFSITKIMSFDKYKHYTISINYNYKLYLQYKTTFKSHFINK